MKILRKNDNWNKINTREELLELLKKYNRNSVRKWHR